MSRWSQLAQKELRVCTDKTVGKVGRPVISRYPSGSAASVDTTLMLNRSVSKFRLFNVPMNTAPHGTGKEGTNEPGHNNNGTFGCWPFFHSKKQTYAFFTKRDDETDNPEPHTE